MQTPPGGTGREGGREEGREGVVRGTREEGKRDRGEGVK